MENIFEPYNKLIVTDRDYEYDGTLRVIIFDTYDGKLEMLQEKEFYTLQPLLNLPSCDVESIKIACCCNGRNNKILNRLINTYVNDNYNAVDFITVKAESIIMAKMLSFDNKIELDSISSEFSLYFDWDRDNKILYFYSDAYILKLEDLFFSNRLRNFLIEQNLIHKDKFLFK